MERRENVSSWNIKPDWRRGEPAEILTWSVLTLENYHQQRNTTGEGEGRAGYDFLVATVALWPVISAEENIMNPSINLAYPVLFHVLL